VKKNNTDDKNEDEQLGEILAFASNEVEGPTLIQPLPPKPYYTCSGCRYFSKSMAHSGGMRGTPTYFKTCTHPSVHTEYKKGKSLSSLTGGFGGKPSSDERTPDWCPVLVELERQHD